MLQSWASNLGHHLQNAVCEVGWTSNHVGIPTYLLTLCGGAVTSGLAGAHFTSHLLLRRSLRECSTPFLSCQHSPNEGLRRTGCMFALTPERTIIPTS